MTIEALLQYIPGPDFPTAGFILGREGIREAYRTGRGIIQMRAKAMVEQNRRTGRESVIVTEIPFQVNKARLIEKIADLVKEKKIEGISDLRDESDRDGMRIVIELKKDDDSPGHPQPALQDDARCSPPSASSCWPLSTASRRS